MNMQISQLSLKMNFNHSIMKNLFFTIVLFCLVIICHSQVAKNPDKFKYYSFSVSPITVYFDSSTGGIALNAEVTFSYNKHLFQLSFNTGSEFTILGGEGESYDQFNISYVKELKLNKTIHFDVFPGLGYFSFKHQNVNYDLKRVTGLGIPLGTKLRFKVGKRFSLGLGYLLNFNSINNINTLGILLQWDKI